MLLENRRGKYTILKEYSKFVLCNTLYVYLRKWCNILVLKNFFNTELQPVSFCRVLVQCTLYTVKQEIMKRAVQQIVYKVSESLKTMHATNKY